MSEYEGSVVIARTTADVWAYVADLASTPEWRTTVRTVDPPETLAVGATFDATTRVLGRTWRWVLALDQYDPPTALTYSVVEGFTDLTVGYRLAPVDGGCRFTLRAIGTPRRRVERWLEPLAGRALRRETDRHLANLQARLEDGRVSDTDR